MTFLNEWLLLVTVMLVAVASPGPDFIMAVRNSVMHGRMAGVYTALGFAAGVIVHVSYCLLGLSAIIAQSVLLFTILKIIGAIYLIWIGIKALRSKGLADINIDGASALPDKAGWPAFYDGFITNLLNPKAILYFFALFTQILQPHQPPLHMLAYGATCVIMTGLWFCIVALFLTTPRVRSAFLKGSALLDKVCGGLFILLGVRLVLQKAH